jgi:3-(3-hydroxy-phenyl)propionate hydroxylase
MCAGIRDVSNLAWKLADVITGRSADGLLDTYESERSPHVREYITRAVRLGGIINTRNTGEALAALGRKGDETITFTSGKPRLGPGLWASADPLAGYLAPQPALSSGVRIDSNAGYQFVLLSTPAFAVSLTHHVRNAMQMSRVHLIDDPAPAGWLNEIGVEAALLRPDRHVLGTADDERGLSKLLQLLAIPATAQS